MILRFTDDYINYIVEAERVLGRIQTKIALKEPYLGKVVELDKMYYQSIALSALVDHLSSDNNATPEDNEYLLQCLKKILSTDICGTSRPSGLSKPVYLTKTPPARRN